MAVRKPQVLLLAAGSARRFGSDKRLVTVYKHLSLVEATVSLYQNAGFDVRICVSGQARDAALLKRFSGKQAECMPCARSSLGMGFTIADAIMAFKPPEGVFIALGDMPLINPETLRAIASAAHKSKIVYPAYRAKRGHPVFFGADFYPHLEALCGDQGAASLVRRFAANCLEIPVDDPGILQDIDTREDLDAAIPKIRAHFQPEESG